MEKQINSMLDKLSLEELRLLESDTCSAPLFKDMIRDRIESIERLPSCAVCGGAVERDSHYTVVFGPRDLRKKAHFCAIDCMEYFIAQLKAATTPKTNPEKKTKVQSCTRN